MNAPITSSFSRFHAIVAATPRDAYGPPVIDTQLIRPTGYATTSDLTPLAKKRKREQDGASGNTSQQGRNSSARTSVRLYDGQQQLLNALRTQFQQAPDVEFHGYYELEEAGVSHKQRIQILTHEIWRTTGYRFTVKDHPRINSGHKTRFWCSQDQAHKNKSKGSRLPGDVPKPRLTSTGDVMAKTRYPCRSRLLISSRDGDVNGRRIVTIRLAHHLAHEPYVDASLPPDIAKSLYDNFGWSAHDNGVDANFTEGSSEQRVFESAVSSAELPTAIALSQLHEPLQLLGMEDEDDEDDDLAQDEEENDADDLGGVAQGLPSQHPIAHGESTPSPAPILMPHAHPPPPPSIPTSAHPDIYHQRMRCHIANIREFCDGLDYQLQFNDTRMLEVVEKEGGAFLNLVEDCLRKEGRLVSVPLYEHNVHPNGSSVGMHHGVPDLPPPSNLGMTPAANGVTGFRQ